MKRLHKLVIMSFLGPFVMTFFIVLFLLLMQFLWRYIDELVGKGLGIEIIAEFFLYASASLVPLALPLAVLLSSLMTFGNMGEFYELTAIKASGISLQRVMLPVIVLVIFISAGAFFFSNNVVPITNLKMRTLRLDMKNLHPEIIITEGVFNKGIENYIIRVGRRDPSTNVLYDIKIYDHSGPRGNMDVTIADSGRMKMTEDKRNMIITLWKGYKYTELNESKRRRDKRFPHQMLKFAEQNIIIQMTGFELSRSDERIFKNSYQMLNVGQLKRAKDSLKRELNMNTREFMNNMIRTNFFRLNSSSVSNARNPYNRMAYTQGQRAFEENRANPAVGERTDPMLARSPDALRAAAQRSARLPRPDLKNNLALNKDTVKKTDSAVIIKTLKKRIGNIDSLYAALSLLDKQRVLTEATTTVSGNTYQISSTTQRMDYEITKVRKHEIEWHRKFTLSMACLIFLFIGAPLGAIIRKGGLGLPTVISTLLFIMYYIISLLGQKFVEEGLLTSFQGMWLSSFILIISGVFLTYQATNDSAILNIDTYMNWFREKTGLRKGILLEKKAHIAGKFELMDVPRAQLQNDFKAVGEMANDCLEKLSTDSGWLQLAKKSVENTGYFYLVEFGVHYNSFIDQVILSQWFRLPYFKKRLTEFPLINGRITSDIFTKKILRWFAVIIFPVGLIRLIHLRLKIFRLTRNLKQVADLSAGMINLLNSSALRFDAETI